ncbi:uncharacterized protein LKV04_010217 [Tautogolabrus adspersus]
MGVHGVPQVSWLSCQFKDENVTKNHKGEIETQLIHREALLQFGQKGDAPVNPHGITFLVTGSKLDLRRYLEGVDAEQLECELYRFSTPGIHIRWPVKADQEYSRWFTCILRHKKGLFKVTSVLRHPTDKPPSGQPDYQSWAEIQDTDILTTTVALVTETKTPSVKARLDSKQKLHCQFAVDHKAPHVTVEWQWHQYGRRDELFSYNSRTGQSQGSGVSLKNLVPHSVQRYSHKKNKDKTYTLTAFFYLKASLRDSGREFTCSVSHRSLREPIIKSFTLTVTEPSFWVLYLGVDLFLLFMLYKMLPYLRLGKRKSVQKPY